MNKSLLTFLIFIFLLLAACAPPAGPVVTTPTVADTAVPAGAAYPGPANTLPPTSDPPASYPGPAAALPLPTDTVAPGETLLPGATDTSQPTLTPTPDLAVRFAVIGDYGGGGTPERDVASLVKSWNPDFIITTGDNNYPDGAAETIDQNIGQFYSEYIYPYQGSYGLGAEENRFFPTIGNHDLNTNTGQPYLDYFTLPGNERYYDFTWGPLHLFALNSDSREPDGVSRQSVQAAWLQERLAASTAPWKIVYMHHPPYSSGLHGSVDWMRWPFKEWGATVVVSGHDHTYERLIIDGFPYFINGLGGGAIYRFETILDGSQARYADDYGAMLVEANSTHMTFQFINRSGEVIDAYTIEAPQSLLPARLSALVN